MRSLRLNPTMVFAGTGIVLMTVVLLVGVAQDRGAVAIDCDDIGGVVTGPGGPEAGVWVIAETTDLPIQFRRIVVTDDRGRYVVPDLPQASYRVWVRGYGLVDSAPVTASPGELVAHSVQAAPSERAAAEIYPASYWYSLIAVPDEDQFPMTLGSGRAGATQNPELRGPRRRGMQHQAEWINAMKHDCQLCHQLGTKLTREMPHNLGEFDSTVAAWDRRVKSGQLGGMMSGGLARFGRERALEMYADWTDRIAAGEVPPMPPRPQGVERNVVISLWDWAGPTGFVHDEIATDKRNTTVNARGATPLWVAAFGANGSFGQIFAEFAFYNMANSSADVVRALLDGGADQHLTTDDGTDPAHGGGGSRSVDVHAARAAWPPVAQRRGGGRGLARSGG